MRKHAKTKVCERCHLELPLVKFGRARKGAADGRLDWCRDCGVPSAVMVYGLGEPLAGREPIEQQLLLAHRYRNALVEVARNERAAWYEIVRQVGDVALLEREIAALDEWISAGVGRIQEIRKRDRKRTRTPELSACVKALRTARKRRARWLGGLRRAATTDPAIAAAIEAMRGRVLEAQKALRAGCGVYWGTYQLVEDAVKQAAKAAAKEGHAARFVAWRGYSDRVGDDGRLSVQIIRGADGLVGMTLDEIVGGSDARVRIVPRSEPKERPPPRSEAHRRHRERCDRDRKNVRRELELHLRVASDEKGGPVWARWPVLVGKGRGRTDPLADRPLPPDARIKRVTVQRRRIGTRFRWEAVVSYSAESLRAPKRLDDEMAGVDVGWRKVEGGLRVAYVVDARGQHRELVLPDEILSRIARADATRGLRDEYFEALRPRLARWLREHEHPEWLARSLAHIEKWRSTAKLTRIAYRWAERRFGGDEEIFAMVDEWRRRDRHLYQIEASRRARAFGCRRDLYRRWARELAERYAVLVFEDFDLRKMARKALPDEPADERGAREHRFVAAVSELRLYIGNALRRRGGEKRERSAVNSTRRCHACLALCEWDAAELLHHTCEHCGATWDQDANAAQNLLQDERSGGDENPGAARSGSDDAQPASGRDAAE